MTLATVKYVRKPFYVDAVQVTDENMEEVAAWCGGNLVMDSRGKIFIKVDVHRPMNEKQTEAYSGHWVLKAGTGFKVYASKAFTNAFEKAANPAQLFEAQDRVLDAGMVPLPNEF